MYNPYNGKIYLFGGVNYQTGENLKTISELNLKSESAPRIDIYDPVKLVEPTTCAVFSKYLNKAFLCPAPLCDHAYEINFANCLPPSEKICFSGETYCTNGYKTYCPDSAYPTPYCSGFNPVCYSASTGSTTANLRCVEGNDFPSVQLSSATLVADRVIFDFIKNKQPPLYIRDDNGNLLSKSNTEFVTDTKKYSLFTTFLRSPSIGDKIKLCYPDDITTKQICSNVVSISPSGSSSSSSSSSSSGTVANCGNGSINTGEQCDDGNKNSGDGCSSTCSSEHKCLTFTSANVFGNTSNIRFSDLESDGDLDAATRINGQINVYKKMAQVLLLVFILTPLVRLLEVR